jgi:hypothetical protein
VGPGQGGDVERADPISDRATLRERAAANDRSVQKELIAILSAAADERPPTTPVEPLRLVTTRTDRSGRWGRDALYDAAR